MSGGGGGVGSAWPGWGHEGCRPALFLCCTGGRWRPPWQEPAASLCGRSGACRGPSVAPRRATLPGEPWALPPAQRARATQTDSGWAERLLSLSLRVLSWVPRSPATLTMKSKSRGVLWACVLHRWWVWTLGLRAGKERTPRAGVPMIPAFRALGAGPGRVAQSSADPADPGISWVFCRGLGRPSPSSVLVGPAQGNAAPPGLTLRWLLLPVWDSGRLW